MLNFSKIAIIFLFGLFSLNNLDAGNKKKKNSCRKKDFFKNVDDYVPVPLKNCEQCFSLISEKVDQSKKTIQLNELATLIGHVILWHRQGHIKF